MVHNKQIYKTKEPVKMRFRKLADGSHSIYLDYYINGRRSYEFLKLYLVPETDTVSKEVNRYFMGLWNDEDRRMKHLSLQSHLLNALQT